METPTITPRPAQLHWTDVGFWPQYGLGCLTVDNNHIGKDSLLESEFLLLCGVPVKGEQSGVASIEQVVGGFRDLRNAARC